MVILYILKLWTQSDNTEELSHCWPIWGRFTDALYPASLLEYNHAQFQIFLQFSNYGPMKLINIVQLEEPLHFWLNWWLYISAAFEGAFIVALGHYTHCA